MEFLATIANMRDMKGLSCLPSSACHFLETIMPPIRKRKVCAQFARHEENVATDDGSLQDGFCCKIRRFRG